MKKLTFQCLWKAIEETELTPEELAPYFGVGNVTLRRWKSLSKSKEIPKVYRQAIVEGIYQLVIEEKIEARSPAIQNLLHLVPSSSFEAVMKGMGGNDIFQSHPGKDYSENMVLILSKIGINEKNRKEVDANVAKIRGFQKLGREWRKRIITLAEVIRSPKLNFVDKFVAYGALFYLIFPFDLIPDNIPVVGLLDDYAILGLATAYYIKRFPKLRK